MQRVAGRHRGFSIDQIVVGFARHPLLLERADLYWRCDIRCLCSERKSSFHSMDSSTLRALIGNGGLHGLEADRGRFFVPRLYRESRRLSGQKSRGRGIETARDCLPQQFMESASIAFRNFTNEKFNNLRRLLIGDSGSREVANEPPLGSDTSSENGREGEELPTDSSGKSPEEFEWRAALWEAEVSSVEELKTESNAELLAQSNDTVAGTDGSISDLSDSNLRESAGSETENAVLAVATMEGTVAVNAVDSEIERGSVVAASEIEILAERIDETAAANLDGLRMVGSGVGEAIVSAAEARVEATGAAPVVDGAIDVDTVNTGNESEILAERMEKATINTLTLADSGASEATVPGADARVKEAGAASMVDNEICRRSVKGIESGILGERIEDVGTNLEGFRMVCSDLSDAIDSGAEARVEDTGAEPIVQDETGRDSVVDESEILAERVEETRTTANVDVLPVVDSGGREATVSRTGASVGEADAAHVVVVESERDSVVSGNESNVWAERIEERKTAANVDVLFMGDSGVSKASVSEAWVQETGAAHVVDGDIDRGSVIAGNESEILTQRIEETTTASNMDALRLVDSGVTEATVSEVEAGFEETGTEHVVGGDIYRGSFITGNESEILPERVEETTTTQNLEALRMVDLGVSEATVCGVEAGVEETGVAHVVVVGEIERDSVATAKESEILAEVIEGTRTMAVDSGVIEAIVSRAEGRVEEADALNVFVSEIELESVVTGNESEVLTDRIEEQRTAANLDVLTMVDSGVSEATVSGVEASVGGSGAAHEIECDSVVTVNGSESLAEVTEAPKVPDLEPLGMVESGGSQPIVSEAGTEPIQEITPITKAADEVSNRDANVEIITAKTETTGAIDSEVRITTEVSSNEATSLAAANVEVQNLEKLRCTVKQHSYLYNTLDAPIISDAAYDSLVRELKLEVQASEKVSDLDWTVGAEPSPTMLKVAHSIPMLSLASEQNEEEVLLWHERLQQKLGPKQLSLEWVVEPKVDGLALSLIYEHGNLKHALTRGNGMQGEDVTHNAQNVLGIPLTIPQPLPGTERFLPLLEVRGEIFMSLKHFKQLNALKLQAGEKPFANPRNAAAGSMRLLAVENTKERPLSFIAYNVANINVAAKPGKGRSEKSLQELKTQWEALHLLHSLGFVVNDDNKLFNTFDAALAYAKGWKDKRHTLEYEADGVVLKVNDLATQALLGTTGGAPRWALAWKFAATEAVTVLEGIELTVGRTGVIIPNARLKPVELGGVSVSRASLHNVGHVVALGLCEGDHIIIQRAGDVIPQVVQVLEELRPSQAKPWSPPKKCPSCESKLTERSASPMIFCQNLSCPSRQSRQVEHFAKTLISGLGSTALRQLEEDGLVVDPADLYVLDTEALSNIKGFGKLSVNKLLKAIEESKQKDLSLFVAALGIPRVGITTAEELAKHFRGLRALLSASEKDFLCVPGIGESTAAVIYDWCHSKPNIEFINKLEAVGCKINPSTEMLEPFVESTTEEIDENSSSMEWDELLVEQTAEITESYPSIGRSLPLEEQTTAKIAETSFSKETYEPLVEQTTAERAESTSFTERTEPSVEPATAERTKNAPSTLRFEPYIEQTTAERAENDPSTERHETFVESTTEDRTEIGASPETTSSLGGDAVLAESDKGRREDLEESSEVEAAQVRKLHGKVVVVTGDFGKLLRKDMEKLIKSHGGLYRTTVTSKTNLLVVGNRPGREKLLQAEEKGVELVDWAEFQKLIV